MRFKINLASQPYENARRFFTQWGVVLVILLVLSAALVLAAAKTWRTTHVLARSVDDERARLEKLNTQEKADLAILNQDQNRDVRERSQAINALIVRKEFSWTRIFSDLEKIMPTRLHVVAITPQLTHADQIEIRMQVGGDSREKGLELLQNMEKAPDFRDARLTSENAAQKGSGGDAYTFEITALYVPSAAAAISQAEKTPSANGDGSGESGKPAEANTATPQPSKTGAPRQTQVPKPAVGGKK